MPNLTDNWTLDRAPGQGKAIDSTGAGGAPNVFVPAGPIIVGTTSPPVVFPALPEPGTPLPPPGVTPFPSPWLAFRNAVGFDSFTLLKGVPAAATGRAFSLSTWIDAGVTTVAGWTPNVDKGTLYANAVNDVFTGVSFWPGGGNNSPPTQVGLTFGDLNEGVDVTYPSDSTTNKGWFHLMYSAKVVSAIDNGDGTTAVSYHYQIYSNDTEIADVRKTIQSTGFTSTTQLDFTTSAQVGGTVGNTADPPGGDGLDVALCEYWAKPVFIDWSVAANRAKFHVTSGVGAFQTWAPCDLGPRGARPGFGLPLLYLSGGDALFPINRATGSKLTVSTSTTGLFAVDDGPS